MAAAQPTMRSSSDVAQARWSASGLGISSCEATAWYTNSKSRAYHWLLPLPRNHRGATTTVVHTRGDASPLFTAFTHRLVLAHPQGLSEERCGFMVVLLWDWSVGVSAAELGQALVEVAQFGLPVLGGGVDLSAESAHLNEQGHGS